MSEDYYNLLGISKGASTEEIKKAFKKMAVTCHPDKQPDNPNAEDQFKKINEAYSVLSDPDKKRMYDQFGHAGINGGMSGMPGMSGMSGMSGGMDINDILKNVFGGAFPGGGGHSPTEGFSFVFSGDGNGGGAGGPDIEDMFGNIFGNGFPFGGINIGRPGGRRGPPPDVIEVGIDINDIYYGNNKRVEFEILDLCGQCGGCGASDPSHIVKCLACKGAGSVVQQMGPFLSQKVRCNACGGKGSSIKNNKVCGKCNGEKTVYNKKIFELKLPKGVPNGHEVKMEKKGSYDEGSKQNKDIIFKFKYNIKDPYILDDHMNVIYNINITIDELLAGFNKKIKLYKDDVVLKSERYFNPTKSIVVKGKGIYNSKKNKQTDLVLKFYVEFTDNERLSKYNDIMQKVLKKENNIEELDSSINVIDISKLMS